ncbi:hypothetical protein JAAARDRAFT_206634 [Jaapia argillacea MUCL 33604]|uniref:Major facilitator superfamily (MFS) profile domain-containing protein n=1 Tax=Jaapia argillacea MUCL 33604 TaxID=933084 RepID=A0A067PVM5_9AGAM|nr:hypothetical protein JAAARDRAFT_206634 [Jaapia argillacea MUCL 33604]
MTAGDVSNEIEVSDGVPLPNHTPRKPPGRISFADIRVPISFISQATSALTPASERRFNEDLATPRPEIPSVSNPHANYSTPLPVVPMMVLSITVLGEFLSANVSAPFLLFMVKGFGGFTDEADAGFWTGILTSVFFLTQFLTSLLWAALAQKYGQRAVLFASLLGTACSCCYFGTATSLKQAIMIRLVQGAFGGAIGVARGCVAVVTDSTNEGRAYAIMGFCWGLGGVAGAVVGGLFESPALKWPGVFGSMPLFVRYPYLLPCAVASSITFTGATLSLFLGYNGGPRELSTKFPAAKTTQPASPIQEVDEEAAMPIFDEPEQIQVFGSIPKSMGRKLSGYFATSMPNGSPAPASPSILTERSVLISTPGLRSDGRRPFSRTSSYRLDGSVYNYRRGTASIVTTTGTVSGSLSGTVLRRLYNAPESSAASSGGGGDETFARRLLMANENAVTNIADLWVASAINLDDDVGNDQASSSHPEGLGRIGGDREDDVEEAPTRRTSIISASTQRGRQQSRSRIAPFWKPSLGRRLSYGGSHSRFGSPRRSSSRANYTTFIHHPPHPSYEDDVTTTGTETRYPSIFRHVGVRTPPALVAAQESLHRPELTADTRFSTMNSSRVSLVGINVEQESSLFRQLPWSIIIQYGLLALHTTTHDQVFYLYLVTDYEGGGLSLNAGHFSELIALMCLAQIVYQFYLYPAIGPPRGSCSHLAMFRLGTLLFIPGYVTVTLYRAVFAGANGERNIILMAALALSTAVRYCGATFAFTAVSILLNYMSPPHVIGIANGLAQSIVSLARFFGPIFGGLLWSMSVAKDPSGYALGFVVCSSICLMAIVHSFFIH